MEWTIRECIDYCHDKGLIGEVNHANLINQLEDFENLDLEKGDYKPLDFNINDMYLILDYFKARNIIEPTNRYVDKCLNIMKNFLKEVRKCH